MEDKVLADKLNFFLIKYGQDVTSERLLFELAFRNIKEQFFQTDEISDTFSKKIKEVPASLFIDVDNLLIQFGLGREWYISFVVLFTTGKMLVPRHNLYITDSKENLVNESRKVVLVLNIDTTLEDIKQNFERIGRELKAGSVRSKKNVTWKSLDQYRNHLMRTDIFRMIMARAEFIKNLSVYESAVFKDKSKTDIEKLKVINDYRTQNGQPKAKLKNKLSVRDVIRTYSRKKMKSKDVRKYIASMRQADKRQKRDAFLH